MVLCKCQMTGVWPHSSSTTTPLLCKRERVRTHTFSPSVLVCYQLLLLCNCLVCSSSDNKSNLSLIFLCFFSIPLKSNMWKALQTGNCQIYWRESLPSSSQGDNAFVAYGRTAGTRRFYPSLSHFVFIFFVSSGWLVSGLKKTENRTCCSWRSSLAADEGWRHTKQASPTLGVWG